jgi:ribosomal protein S27AE
MTTTSPSSPLTDAEWAARTARLTAARKREYERRPKLCPHCSEDNVFPTFDGDLYECGDCGQPFEVTR